MTQEEVRQEFIRFCEESDHGQGSPHIPWDWWVANVLLPRTIANHDEELYVMDHGKPSGLDRSTRREKESRDRGYY